MEESNKDISDQELLLTEIEPTIEKEYPAKKNNENISSAQKIKDEKESRFFFQIFLSLMKRKKKT